MSTTKLMLIAATLVFYIITITLSGSPDPAGPGPPKFSHSISSQNSNEQLDLNLSGNSHEINYILPKKRGFDESKVTVDQLSATSLIVNNKNSKTAKRNLCTTHVNNARKFINDDDTVVAVNTVKVDIENKEESSVVLVLDLINDVFETTSEPLVPGIVYKGRI